MVAPVLSPRELEVLVTLAAGANLKEAADRLGIHRSTLRDHLATIRLKLGADSNYQAVLIAERRKLLKGRAA